MWNPIRRGILFLTAASLLSGQALAVNKGASAVPAAEDGAAFDGYLVRVEERRKTLLKSAWQKSPLEKIKGAKKLFSNVYRVDSAEDVEQLERDGVLTYAEPNYTVLLGDVPEDALLSGGEQWNFPALGMDYCQDHHLSGTGVRVGIVDSGVYADHEELATARLMDGTNYTVPADDPLRGDTTDNVGHGTFVAGLIAAAAGNGVGIAGIAPEVELVPLKCFDSKSGSVADLAAAIHDSVDTYHCQVLNLSFGLPQQSAILREAVEYADQNGVIMVAASGNLSSNRTVTGNDPLYYPAAYPEVIGVGAVDGEGDVAAYSCRNESVWVSAPGSGLWSLSHRDAERYAMGSGTSYAAPVVTAAAALALSAKPSLDRAELMDLLRLTAWDRGTPGYDTAYGYGILSVGLLLSSLQGDIPYQAVTLSERYGGEAVTLLAAYDERGALLYAEPLEAGESPNPPEDADSWKLFALNQDGLTPIDNARPLYGPAA